MPSPPATKRPKSKRLLLWFGSLSALLVCCCNPISIRVGMFEAFEIDGPSMAPNYPGGDRVVVAKYAFGLFLPFTNEAQANWGSPELGDVVIARSPMDDTDILKRVVGLPGDTIAMRGNDLVRNGRIVSHRALGPAIGGEPDEANCIEETLGDHRHPILVSNFAVPFDMEAVTVPADHYFVMGDYRDRSNDSRNPRVGPIPVRRIKGRVVARYFRGASGPRCPER